MKKHRSLLCIIALLLSLCTTSDAQIITTFAGIGTQGYSGDGNQATAAQVKGCDHVLTDTAGNVYILDQGNFVVRKVNTSGIITTIAGNGASGCSGDGGPATGAQFTNVRGIGFDIAGNLIISDGNCQRIRIVNSAGTITTIAGTGTAGFSGDGGPATLAQFKSPMFAAIDDTGNIYVSDRDNYRIRKINTAGIITTIAGNGTPTYTGGGVPATNEGIFPRFMYIKNNEIYLSFWLGERLFKIDAAGIITTIAGTGVAGFSGDGGPATAAQLSSPQGIAIDNAGNIYFADGKNYRVRKINTAGIISTIAGNGVMGYAGDGGPATAAQFSGVISGIALSKSGQLYITDAGSFRVRRIDNVTAVDDVGTPNIALKVYPNPATNELIIATNGESYQSFVITNCVGKRVLEEQFTNPQTTINVRVLPAGVYYIKLVGNKGTVVRKFTKL